MRLILGLALRDLWRDWARLVCNIAVMAGVLVPLLVLFGVRNGVYEALLGQLLRNPAALQIDTRGNSAFTPADAEEVRGWPETAFVTLKTRSLFDYVNVRPAGQPAVREAVAVPTGAGDPMLEPLPGLGADEIAVSAPLAAQLGLGPGDAVELVTQAPERPRQLVLARRIGMILPEARAAGRAVLADLGTLDLIEAFYDEYALPEHGIATGRPLAGRVADYEGMRAYAASLEALAPLQARMEARFGVATEAQTARVMGVLGLGRNLGLALALTAAVAGTGLAAALVFGFWAEVARKRHMLAGLGLIGLPPAALGLIPMVQALVTALLGLAVSFALFAVAGAVAERLFASGLTEEGGLVRLAPGQGLAIAAGVVILVTASALAAARAALRTDPAVVLREAP